MQDTPTTDIVLFPKPQPSKYPPYPGEVPLFSWYDVVHIYPEHYLPKAEQKRRKVQRYLRWKNSGVPEIVDQIGTVMNYFDDIEDFLITAATLLRFVLPKVAPRLVPYVGWVLLAADVVNLLQVWRFIMPSGAGGKQEQWNLKEMNPFGTIARARRIKRLARRVPVLGEWLEILQTTDNLFGIGISFGPLIGAAESVLAGIISDGYTIWERWTQTDPVIESAILLLQSIGTVPVIKHFTPYEFMHYAVAQSYAYSVLNWFYTGDAIEKNADHLQLKISPRPIRNPITRQILLDDNTDPDKKWRWPIPGSPRYCGAHHLTIEHPEYVSWQWAQQIKTVPFMQLDWFVGSLMVQIAKDAWSIISGDPDNLDFEPTLETSIMLRQTEQGISPYLLDKTDDWRLLRNQMEHFQRTNGRWPTQYDYLNFANQSKKEFILTEKPFYNMKITDFDIMKPTEIDPETGEPLIPYPEHSKEAIVEEMAVPLPETP